MLRVSHPILKLPICQTQLFLKHPIPLTLTVSIIKNISFAMDKLYLFMKQNIRKFISRQFLTNLIEVLFLIRIFFINQTKFIQIYNQKQQKRIIKICVTCEKLKIIIIISVSFYLNQSLYNLLLLCFKVIVYGKVYFEHYFYFKILFNFNILVHSTKSVVDH